MTADPVQHAFHGRSVRVITDEHGDPWFVLRDLLDALGIARRPASVIERLDADGVRQTYLTDSLGRQQETYIVSEPGMYEVVIRSDAPRAAEFRRWITTEVLPSIRRTGSYGTAPALTGPALVAAALIEAHAMLEQKDAVIAELAPPARAWEALADAAGDYSLRDAAQILDRDPAIKTGQNRLGQYLRQVGWLDRRGIPYQSRVDQGLIRSRARTYNHPRTGEQMVGEPQVRITTKGLGKLHTLLGGEAPLDIERHLMAVPS